MNILGKTKATHNIECGHIIYNSKVLFIYTKEKFEKKRFDGPDKIL